MKGLESCIILQFIYLFIIIYKNYNVNIEFFFLITLALYNLPLILMSLIKNKEYVMNSTFLLTANNIDIFKALLLLCSFSFGFGLNINFKRKIGKKEEIIVIKNNKKTKYYVIIIFILSLLVLYKVNLQIKYIQEVGYLSIYNGGLSNISYPIWTKGVITIYPIVYYLFLFQKPSKKYFYICTVVYILTSFYMSLRGGRTFLFISIIGILIYYINIYNGRIKIKPLIFIGFFLIFISELIKNFRTRINLEIPFFDKIMIFIEEQGASFMILPLYFKYEHVLISKVKFSIFSSIIDILKKNSVSATKEYVEATSSLGVNLTYKIMPEIYLMGGGLGSNFLAEIYSLGGNFLAIIFGIIIGKICKKISSREIKDIFFMMVLINSLLTLARGSVLPSETWIKIIIIYLAIKILYKLIILKSKERDMI